MKTPIIHLAAAAAIPFAPAVAQSTGAPSAFTIGGSAGIASDYRLRGVSQTDGNPQIQGGFTLSHASGLYAGIWGSNLAGWGTFGGANMELDLIGGFRTKLNATTTLDVGLTWYMYPGGADRTDYGEPFAKLSGTAGPLTLLAGVAYAPKQQALGRWYDNGAQAAAGTYAHPGARHDNAYLWGDGALAIIGTPLTAKAHIGHSRGNRGLGPNATSAAPTGSYWDWSLGMDATWRNFTLNVSYVDTDITRAGSAYLLPSFSKGQDGHGGIAGATPVVSLIASF